MPLGAEVGLGPGHIVLDGDSAPLKNWHRTPTPIFGTMSIVVKQSPVYC